MEINNGNTQQGGEKLESTIRSEEDEIVIPVIQEHLVIDKEVIETGKVLVRKTTTEEEAILNIPLIHETYDVERVPVKNTYKTEPVGMRQEGDTIIISVIREVAVVQKHYEVVEEIRLTKKITETPQIQQMNLRKEQVHVDRVSNDGKKQRL